MGTCASVYLYINTLEEMKDSNPERQKTIVYLKDIDREEFESLDV